MVTPDQFVSGVRAFFDMLGAITRVVAGEHERVEWNVRVKKGSRLIGVDPAPGTSVAIVERVLRAMSEGVEDLEREAAEPEGFSETALRSVQALARVAALRDDADTRINLWAGTKPIAVTRQAAEHVGAVLAEAYSDEGSVEGELRTVSVAGGFRVVVYEPIFERAIRCDIPEHMMPQALALFGRRVEVYGAIRYRKNGSIARVAVREIIPFPPPDRLPSHEDVRRILRGATAPMDGDAL